MASKPPPSSTAAAGTAVGSTQPLLHDSPADDVANPKFAAAALDFLLIELVPLAQRLTDQLLARDAQLVAEHSQSRMFATPASTTAETAESTSADGEVATAMTSLGFPVVGEETREGMMRRLDGLGYRVGQGLVERFSLSRPRPTTPLDAIKFLCKDLWPLLFGRKQIDNLKTNHRGTFVLTDARFHPLARMSLDRRAGAAALDDAVRRAQMHLYFPCGVIRGALSGLGVDALVDASSVEMPTATFQIKTVGASATTATATG